jgi:hypothetical protein
MVIVIESYPLTAERAIARIGGVLVMAVVTEQGSA